MNELKCESCGAGLDATPADRAAGSCRCPYCNSVNQLPRDEKAEQKFDLAALQAQVANALGGRLVDPTKKPAGCDIELTQTPGVEFHAEIRGNRAGVGTWVGVLVGGLFGGVGGGVWTGLGLAAFFTHGILSAALLGLAVFLTIVAVVLATRFISWRRSGVEIIDARNGVLTVARRSLGMNRRALYPWDQILAVVRENTGVAVNHAPIAGLYLKMAKRGRARIAKRAKQQDLPWLGHELNRFFQPIIGKEGEK